MSVSSCTAFHGQTQIASGDLHHVAAKAKEVLDRDHSAQILIFDDLSSELVEVDFRGTPEQVAARLAAGQPHLDDPQRRPGRPKLGVVAREVTLLPRHWEWLATQPGGASVALRKLVEHGIRNSRDADTVRRAQEVTYRFVSAMAGNEPGFEEAIRALFRAQQERFHEWIEAWPADIRDHTKKLAVSAFPAAE